MQFNPFETEYQKSSARVAKMLAPGGWKIFSLKSGDDEPPPPTYSFAELTSHKRARMDMIHNAANDDPIAYMKIFKEWTFEELVIYLGERKAIEAQRRQVTKKIEKIRKEKEKENKQ